MILPPAIEVFLRFGIIGATTLGGGYAIVPMVERLASRQAWMSAIEFRQLVALAQMAPGPIGVNLPVLVGHRRAGVSGAIAALLGILTPSVGAIVLLGAFYQGMMAIPWLQGAMRGVRIMVAGVIAGAGLGLLDGRKVGLWDIGGLALSLILVFLGGWGVVPVLAMGLVWAVLTLTMQRLFFGGGENRELPVEKSGEG